MVAGQYEAPLLSKHNATDVLFRNVCLYAEVPIQRHATRHANRKAGEAAMPSLRVCVDTQLRRDVMASRPGIVKV
eukprot:162452-Chlamydomonas_euryale.AAC.5